MIVEVAFLPLAALAVERKVCIVIDALRASATVIAMLDAGARAIVLAATVDQAREIAARSRETHWLVGEVGGQPPPDFDFGNSPTEIAHADLLARTVVFATSNGTRALARLATAPAVFVGSLLNGRAIAARAHQEATRLGFDLCIVCSGDEGGTLLSLEDLVSAGVLVEWLRALEPTPLPPEDSAAALPGRVALDESALVASRLYRSYLGPGVSPLPPDPAALAQAFREARHERDLIRLGYLADVAHCQTPDLSTALPLLVRQCERLAIVPAQ